MTQVSDAQDRGLEESGLKTDPCSTLSIAALANLVKGLFSGAMGQSGSIADLPLHHRVITTQRYKYVFRFAAGQAGAWDVQLSAEETVQPKLKNNNELDFERVQQEPTSNQYGTFVQVVKGTVQGLLEDAFGLDKISEELATDDVKSGKGVVDEVLKKVSAFADTFKTTILLPAGDVFEFVGLDTDQFGNLYSNINYATPQGGSVVKKALT